MVRLETRTFDQLVDHATIRPTVCARAQVLTAIASMGTWYFVQCGRVGAPVPWIVFEDDQPLAMVFTDERRASKVASAMIEDDSVMRVVGLPPAAAVLYLAALGAQGVASVCFNHGPCRFDATIEEALVASAPRRHVTAGARDRFRGR